MTDTRTLLLEVGTEELPPLLLQTLAEDFRDHLVKSLSESGLCLKDSQQEPKTYATPRRLAVQIPQTRFNRSERKLLTGPPLNRALDERGQLTPAAEGFARKHSLSIPEKIPDYRADQQQPGFYKNDSHLLLIKDFELPPLSKLLAKSLNSTLTAIRQERSMYWGEGHWNFIRPVRWINIMLGEEIIDATVMGLQSAGRTYGHRFMGPAAGTAVQLQHADDYEQTLEDHFVIADFAKRQQLIRKQLESTAKQLGGSAECPRELLDEVTSLVEWPVAISGHFEAEFLQLPRELLLAVMQKHQRYFALTDTHGELLPHFITMANLQSNSPQIIAEGNARVLRPRLADAKFFYDQDRRESLETMSGRLGKITYYRGLGTLQDKTDRLLGLSLAIARVMKRESTDIDRAAKLCKADLCSRVVGEFDNLQGIIGADYAQRDGEPAAVIRAIAEHLLPRFAEDRLPDTGPGLILALADRLDTLSSFFSIGKQPKGSNDPFALRRSALGIVRIICESKLSLGLSPLLDLALDQVGAQAHSEQLNLQILSFIQDRQLAWYQKRGYAAELCDAVINTKQPADDLLDIEHRLLAVANFSKTPAAPVLASAYKRIANILSKHAGEIDNFSINESILSVKAEKKLVNELKKKKVVIAESLQSDDYDSALKLLSELKSPVDDFFYEVLVIADEKEIRQNRLAIIAQISRLISRIADLSQLTRLLAKTDS